MDELALVMYTDHDREAHCSIVAAQESQRPR